MLLCEHRRPRHCPGYALMTSNHERQASNGALLRIVLQHVRYATATYYVLLLDGEWPDVDTILQLCDPGCYGGAVLFTDDNMAATVEVYTD
jgi:hypothetical protein